MSERPVDFDHDHEPLDRHLVAMLEALREGCLAHAILSATAVLAEDLRSGSGQPSSAVALSCVHELLNSGNVLIAEMDLLRSLNPTQVAELLKQGTP